MNFKLYITLLLFCTFSGRIFGQVYVDTLTIPQEKLSIRQSFEFQKTDEWFSADKGKHIVTGLIITTFNAKLMQSGFDHSVSQSRLTGVAISFSLGLIKELYDSSRPDNIFSWKDLTANAAGILFGVALLEID